MITPANAEFMPLFGPPRGRAGRLRTFRAHAGKAGIYIIREGGRIIYVGMSQHCIVKALYRHFYYWKNDPTRTTSFPRTTYFDRLEDFEYDAAILICSIEDAPKLERGLILSIQPRDNRQRYEMYVDEIVRERMPAENAAAPIAAALEDEDLPF